MDNLGNIDDQAVIAVYKKSVIYIHAVIRRISRKGISYQYRDDIVFEVYLKLVIKSKNILNNEIGQNEEIIKWFKDHWVINTVVKYYGNKKYLDFYKERNSYAVESRYNHIRMTR